MCIYYALKLWLEKGGRFIIIFHPNFHVMVNTPEGIFHGTNKHGPWTIEKVNPEGFARWLARNRSE